jgi:hypothetical protein
MMRYAACLSIETPRPCEGPIGKQVSGTPLYLFFHLHLSIADLGGRT